MKSRDYYEEARLLASNLRKEGFEEWAERFEKTIEDGFTATEILMGLRWQARQLSGSVLQLGQENEDRLAQLIDGLEEVLS